MVTVAIAVGLLSGAVGFAAGRTTSDNADDAAHSTAAPQSSTPIEAAPSIAPARPVIGDKLTLVSYPSGNPLSITVTRLLDPGPAQLTYGGVDRGNRWIAAEFTIENVSNAVLPADQGGIVFVAGDGREYESTSCNGDDYHAGDILPGNTATRCNVGEVAGALDRVAFVSGRRTFGGPTADSALWYVD